MQRAGSVGAYGAGGTVGARQRGVGHHGIVLGVAHARSLARLRCAALRRSVGRARLARRQVLGAAPRIVGVGGARRAGVGTRGRLVEARLAGRALRARRRHALLALAARAALLHRRVEGARRPGRRHAVACRTAHEPIDGAVPDPRRVGRHGRHHIRPVASEARGARLTGIAVGIQNIGFLIAFFTYLEIW